MKCLNFLHFFGNAIYEVMCVGFVKKSVMFFLGGVGYVGLELLWRGRSHASMFLAGGVCFLLLGKLNQARPRLPLPIRCVTGAGIITCVELAAGLLANREYHVWDYRSLPLNFYGQICLPYCLLWIPVSFGAMLLYDWLEEKIERTVP